MQKKSGTAYRYPAIIRPGRQLRKRKAEEAPAEVEQNRPPPAARKKKAALGPGTAKLNQEEPEVTNSLKSWKSDFTKHLGQMEKFTTGFTTLSLAQKAGMDIIQEAKDEVLVKEQMNIAKADEHISQKGKAFMNEAIMDKDPFVKKYLIMRTRDEEGYEDGLRRNLDDALHDLGLPCQRDRRVTGSLFQDTATRCLLLACTLKGTVHGCSTYTITG